MYEICGEFWEEFEKDPDSRSRLERKYHPQYDDAKRKAWGAVDQFADSAAAWLEPRYVRSIRRLRSRLATKPKPRSKAARISSN